MELTGEQVERYSRHLILADVGPEGQEKIMSTRNVIEAYHRALVEKDWSAIRAQLADNLDFKGSMETHTSADSYMEGLKNFLPILEDIKIIQEHYDGSEASTLYDCATNTPIGAFRCGEFFEVEKGKIKKIRLVFDATEFRKMSQQQGAQA